MFPLVLCHHIVITQQVASTYTWMLWHCNHNARLFQRINKHKSTAGQIYRKKTNKQKTQA